MTILGGIGAIGPWLADALVVLGVAVMTIGVYGVIRMPDLYTKLHAASKAVVLGAIAIAAASVVTGEAAIIARVVLISAVLLLTTPVASHVIGRGAYLEGEHMETPGSVDESGHHLADEALPESPAG
ncbi:MAG: Na(+) H(+) antiporter subunit G [uncultured Thermomicrobiales bacterium]|uniref:Na(+) H(+) antiporter subunit G n=1 Tax=uncultured Thermomicrobiales bacterium TaxID=1645740 RepID=A0A6J4VC86_9BACT|nr:MAG: Na(+) H(+) antiporter subunit G [uncultured Thermomicrobiales bacterium]